MVLTHAHHKRYGDFAVHAPGHHVIATDCTLDDRLLAEVCVVLIDIN